MNTTKQAKEAIKQTLENSGVAFEEITVFGAIRCNVHIVCASATTAAKWAAILASSFKGARVTTAKTKFEAKQNKGTCLLPTMRDGFLVAVAY